MKGGVSRSFFPWAILVLAVFVASRFSSTAHAQTPAPAGTQASGDYVFRAPLGMLVIHVRPELASDFEAIMLRVTELLESSTDGTRRQQRTSLRLLRSVESLAAIVYVWVADPVVAGADYDPVRLLTELTPNESPALYERLKASVIKIERLSLRSVP